MRQPEHSEKDSTTNASVWHQFLTFDTARWILLFPALIVVWHLVLLAGVITVSQLSAFCDSDQVISGRCVAPWYVQATDGLTVLFSALSAMLVVAMAYVIAPRFKSLATWIAYVGGVLFAIAAGWYAGAWAESMVAIVAGGMGVWLCTSKAVVRKQGTAQDP